LRSIGDGSVRGRGGQGRVLPRILRRPVRILSRIEWRAPRHSGLKGLALFLLVTATGAMVLGDHTRAVTSAVTAATGLSIDQVKITGQSETSEVEILDRLAIKQFGSLFTFDLDSARERVETLPWVARATLKKLYPETLEVAIVERLPYALWRREGELSLIDPQGRVITNTIGGRYATLPLVIGPGANTRVDEFLSLVLAHPTLTPKVRAGVLVLERRWNIVLADEVEILLPAADPAGALERVVEADAASQLLSRDIAVVDVRSPARFVVRLNESALAGREEIVRERALLAAEKGRRT